MLRFISILLLLAGPLWGASATHAQNDVIELTAAPFDVRANDNLIFADSAVVINRWNQAENEPAIAGSG